MSELNWIIEEETDARLDKYIADHSDLSRTRVKELLNEGRITVDGKPVKGSFRLQPGQEIVIDLPEDRELDVIPQDIPLDILYEDSDIIVVNKPKGMVVHPAPGVYEGTLVNALLYHCKDLSGINGTIRPGIVHRIDKDTTGCIVACKNDLAHESIARQLQDKTCHREYQAIVMGNIPHDDGLIDAPIGRDPRDRQRMCVTDKNSREARTRFHVKERFGSATWVECALETGRTHQIRVHMKYIGHPVMGDEKYGKPCKYMDTEGQVLHASDLTLIHPRTGETMHFTAPLPAYFEELLSILRRECEQR